MKSQNLSFVGTLKEVGKGVRTFDLGGRKITTGYSLKVNTDEGYFATSLLVKTDDAKIAEALANVGDNVVEVHGFLRSENLAKKDQPASWMQFLYVTDVFDIV